MRVTPVHLNSAIAGLFMIGSSCFALGSIPAYVNAVGGPIDGITYFVGSIFFTSASFLQLVQSQTPAATEVDAASATRPTPLRWWAWLPHDRAWLAAITQFPGTLFFNISTGAALIHNATVAEEQRYVWRPDIYGSILFLVSSFFALLAVAVVNGSRRHTSGWRIGWWNMAGSILFMASALASFILPSGELVSTRISVAGTFGGAVCFLVGAALMFPAWRAALHQTQSSRPSTGRPIERNS
ncbi:hypothetical protein [Microlunatus ginsengisoli]|uniref:YrhK domain-containing protein n=1 Tax=Microlunatus ginsengisoli TaxID=363863 RepID=A0ABP6ZM89_9ACTN